MPLNGNERLKVLYDYYHLGDEGSFDFDIKRQRRSEQILRMIYVMVW